MVFIEMKKKTEYNNASELENSTVYMKNDETAKNS
jgi:hypothetical protein